MAGSVPCLRRLIPGDVVAVSLFVLPAVVLPLISKHIVVSPVADPESTRIPARAAFVVIGAATTLLRTRAVIVLPESRTIGKIPGPSVPITLLAEINVVWVPAPRSVRVVGADGDARASDRAVGVDEVVLNRRCHRDRAVDLDLDRDAVDVPESARRGAVVGDVEVPLPAVSAHTAREEAIRLVADAAVPAVHGVAGDRDDVGRTPGSPGVPDWSAGVRVPGSDLDPDTGTEVDDRVVRDRRPVDAGCAGRQSGTDEGDGRAGCRHVAGVGQRVVGDVGGGDRAGPVLDVDPFGFGLADHVVRDRDDSGQVRRRGQAVVEGDAVLVRRVARTGDGAVGEAEPVDLGSVDAAVTGVEESQVAERRTRGVRQRDAVTGCALDRPARVVAALGRAAGAGHGEAAARAGAVQHDAVGRAVGRDGLYGHAARADRGVRHVQRGSRAGCDRVPGALDGDGAAGGGAEAGAAGGVDVEAAAGEVDGVSRVGSQAYTRAASRVEDLRRVAEQGRAAGVARHGDATAGVVGVGDGTAEGDGAAGAAGDVGGGAGAVVEVAGIGDGAVAAVEVEGDAGGAGDVSAGGGECAGSESVEVDAVGVAVGGVDVVELQGGAGGAGDVDGRSAGGGDVVGAGCGDGEGAGVGGEQRRRCPRCGGERQVGAGAVTESQGASGRREADAAGARAGDGDVVDDAGCTEAGGGAGRVEAFSCGGGDGDGAGGGEVDGAGVGERHTGAAGGVDGEVGDVEGAGGGVEFDAAGAAGHDEVVEGAGDVAGAAFDGFGARSGAGDGQAAHGVAVVQLDARGRQRWAAACWCRSTAWSS